MATLFRSPIARLLLAATLGAMAKPAQANDSAAAMAAGGLQLVRSDQVRMVSEVLRIAPRLVEVDYVFENTGATDATTLVAFPLPELSQTVWYYSPLNIPFGKDSNFIGFQVWADGREIKPDIEVRAFGKGGEITAELERLGVDALHPDLSRPEVVDALRRRDLLIGDGTDSKTNKARFVADWSVRVSFHWSQTFPAGKQVAVRHRYRPAYGGFYAHVDPSARRLRDNKDQTLGGQWCFDQSYRAAEGRLLDRQYAAAAKRGDYVSGDYDVWYDFVQYVLKTGANWNGPIGRFELQIDKGGAELVSSCPIPGLQLQRTPYGFNAVAEHYTPTNDLDILFVSSRFLGKPDSSQEQ
ncbi:DUF4424 family protein [Bradyrhizobium tropiciagri]|uniref:DUF4424 family protein n=1 Tax=Bradyrhizobium tropiciagri TaxID=312253 RepID=UPI001BADCDB0|nr:DUF4424 family protein [Bradyrhizobium tropiciagri]MBR0870763.1 DUF4424 family protein [Bradyrhizobium tropiciagri]